MDYSEQQLRLLVGADDRRAKAEAAIAAAIEAGDPDAEARASAHLERLENAIRANEISAQKYLKNRKDSGAG